MERKILGDYNLIKQIGSGPLGAVFLAEHRFIKRHFVLKILPEELSSDRLFIQRFEKQIASLATLEHPSIVKVHNISFADGLYFLVTDCIVDEMGESTHLAHYLTHNERRLSEAEIANILMQIADSLDYAHSKQMDGKALAHRNIKLNNILMGKDGKVYLSDFGLSHIIGEGPLLTRTYKVLASSLGVDIGPDIGSTKLDRFSVDPLDSHKLSKLHESFIQNYAFLAPEQKVVGRTDSVDMKADVWAFGVLAYFLIMHTFPEGHFPLPSAFMREYTRDWDGLIKKCLNPDPLGRPAVLMDLFTEKTEEPVSEPIHEPPAPARSESATATAVQEMTSTETVVETIPSFFKVAPPEPEPAPKPVLKPAEIERPTYEPDPGKVFQVESTVAPYKPQAKEICDVEPLLNEMAIIAGGEYFRGSNEGVRDERPHHRVLIGSFALDVSAVSNEQFVRFLEAMGGEKDSSNNDIIRLRESRIKRSGGKLIIESGYAKHPVVGITWYGAVAYAKWIGKRLPTEAEWEIAARGGLPDAIYPTGSNIERQQANFFSADTTPVMSYPPNGYGLHDMAGNVYEWCQDWYDYHYYDTSSQEPENPTGPLQGVYRVLRGGCWKSLKDDLRCAHRHRNNPGTVNKTYGFRCAADVEA